MGSRTDVVVIGAGAAGLAAAHHLAAEGLSVTVLEAAAHVGGRMATEAVDGYLLDRVGQLLSTAYPELRRTPGISAVPLRLFAPGFAVHSGGRRHRAGVARSTGSARSARGALTAVRALASAPWPSLSPLPAPASLPQLPPRAMALDQARLGTALGRLAAAPTDRLLARPERTAREAYTSPLARLLLSALLYDPGLTSSSRCADLALRGFARGRLCVPEGGAAALPEILAATLPPGCAVHTGVRVTDASINRVSTKEHGEIACRALVVATGARAAAELLPGLRVPDFQQVTVVHHAAPEPPPSGAALLLDADRGGPVSHTAVMSAVDPTRAPRGRTLVSSTVLGPPPPDAEVRRHLAAMYGAETRAWELLAVHHSPEAVVTMRPPHDVRRAVRLLGGLYVCGDHRDTNTVQGALFSGLRAARAVLRDLGAGRTRPVRRTRPEHHGEPASAAPAPAARTASAQPAAPAASETAA
ncbi:NAD(P)/FAD-dependent oxidoreductase [Streptomyces sp. 8L]|uniref:NAD(P)/FAD-dependent oxidoreductase n=1 Tax=Streptomyces sp. 8L TaxID=2877242 RepID=UPI001CD287DC|nr:NAD(P)/FAD-dependent oxidoreductase [Streptomyces sp. 8L]MCA1220538.1 FAD-dependent oxidoreductase [Streptomyces sp. 8L]